MSSLLKDGISIEKYYNLTPEEIQSKIMGINFNKKKSVYISKAAKRIVDECEGVVPSTLKELTKFTGIGNKVAHIILQVGFGISEGVAVDTHVHRVSNLLKWVKSKNPDGTMEQLNEIFEPEEYGELNKVMVGFGQLVCGAKKPKCLECPINLECEIGVRNLRKVKSPKKRLKKRPA